MRFVPIIGLLLLAACSDAAGPGSPPPGPGQVVEAIRVLDGDSFRATIDGEEIEVRLLGVNAPERDECHADPSRAALERLLEEGPVAVDAVATDRFGRRLAYVTAGGADVNLTMIDRGDALALMTDHERRAAYLAAEDEAFLAGAGLFRRDACGPATPDVEFTDIAYDPAGPDADALEGEWVEITNFGEPRPLGGWLLRDESSTNRFAFPDGTAIGSGATIRVVVGCGPDDGGTLHWCNDAPVWNNGGDGAFLLDASGNVAARLRYGP